MGGLTVGKVVLAVVALGILWIGIGFAGFALAAALTPVIGVPLAAAAAAFVLIGTSVVLVLIARPHVAALSAPRKEKEKDGQAEMAMMAALSSVAKDKPLLAVLSAGLFGAADVLLKDRNNK